MRLALFVPAIGNSCQVFANGMLIGASKGMPPSRSGGSHDSLSGPTPGFSFEMSGAVASHVLVGDPIGKVAAPLAFTLLALVSWWFQPDRETLWIRHPAN
jgi:hypothetical protein